MPKLPIRIAILECDTPMSAINTRYGTYPRIFNTLLSTAASQLTPPYPGLSSSSGLEISAWDIMNGTKYPKLENIDAILITGSKFTASDNEPWILRLVEFTKKVLEQSRVRIIGVCFGHQIVGRAMGVRVGRMEGWEASVMGMELTRKGQEVFGKTALALHQMHRDVVFEYPEGVEELGYTEKCKVQSMYVAKRLITVQGHPEFNEDIMRKILDARHASGLFGKEMFDDATARADGYHDGVVIAQAFLRFLLED